MRHFLKFVEISIWLILPILERLSLSDLGLSCPNQPIAGQLGLSCAKLRAKKMCVFDVLFLREAVKTQTWWGKKNLVQSFHPWARPKPRRTQGRTVNPLPFSGVAKSLRTSAIPIPLRASPQGFPRRSPVGGWPWPKGSVARSADLAKLPQISGRAGIYSLWRIGPARRQWRHNPWQISATILVVSF